MRRTYNYVLGVGRGCELNTTDSEQAGGSESDINWPKT
jgi:hypothetical protein